MHTHTHNIHTHTHNNTTHTHKDTQHSTHTQGPSFGIIVKHWGRDVAHLVKLGVWQAADAGQNPCVATQGIFLPVSAFSADSCGIQQPRHATTCINICEHVENPKRCSSSLVQTQENTARTKSTLEDRMWLSKWHGNWKQSSCTHFILERWVYTAPRKRGNAKDEELTKTFQVFKLLVA